MFFVLVEFAKEDPGIVGVAHPRLLEFCGNVTEQTTCAGRGLHSSAIAHASRVFTIASVSQPLAFTKIPEMATGRNPGVRSAHFAVAAIGDRPGLLIVIGGISGIGPGMAILAHL